MPPAIASNNLTCKWAFGNRRSFSKDSSTMTDAKVVESGCPNCGRIETVHDDDAVTEAMLKAGRSAWQSAMKDRNLDQWLARIYLDMKAASRLSPTIAEGVLREALEAADKRLCELTPNFPPDVGPDMRDAEEIEKTGHVVMQIRAALEGNT
jgi:hypothetical protein